MCEAPVAARSNLRDGWIHRSSSLHFRLLRLVLQTQPRSASHLDSLHRLVERGDVPGRHPKLALLLGLRFLGGRVLQLDARVVIHAA